MHLNERVVYVTYVRDGEIRRASGLRITEKLILTADHCAKGDSYQVVANGESYAATVVWRSEHEEVDIAVLRADGLKSVECLPMARVDTRVPAMVGCVALGYPSWSDLGNKRIRTQSDGFIPTGEGLDAYGGSLQLAHAFKITTPLIQDRQVAMGELDRTPWAGFSGSVVIADGRFVLGVIRGHMPAAGVGSLMFTPVCAVESLQAARAGSFWEMMGVTDSGRLPTLPTDTVPPYEPEVVPQSPEYVALVRKIEELKDLHARDLISPGEFSEWRLGALAKYFGSGS